LKKFGLTNNSMTTVKITVYAIKNPTPGEYSRKEVLKTEEINVGDSAQSQTAYKKHVDSIIASFRHKIHKWSGYRQLDVWCGLPANYFNIQDRPFAQKSIHLYTYKGCDYLRDAIYYITISSHKT